jgi:hypothetical protein
VSTVAGYECGLESSAPDLYLIQLVVDSDQDFLEPDNQIIGFTTPKVVPASGEVLLASGVALYTGVDYVEITMGPSDPSTGDPADNPMGWSWNGPLIAADATFEEIHRCDLSSGASGQPDVVATLNDFWPDPVEARSLSGIKGLFR